MTDHTDSSKRALWQDRQTDRQKMVGTKRRQHGSCSHREQCGVWTLVPVTGSSGVGTGQPPRTVLAMTVQ